MHILELVMMNTGSVLELPVYWGEVSYNFSGFVHAYYNFCFDEPRKQIKKKNQLACLLLEKIVLH